MSVVFPRAVPKRKPYVPPYAVTDDLLFAVSQVPQAHKYVTAHLLPDSSGAPSSLLSLVDAFLPETSRDALIFSLPSDDCRVVFAGDETVSMFMWMPPTTLAARKDAYNEAVPTLMKIFKIKVCDEIISGEGADMQTYRI